MSQIEFSAIISTRDRASMLEPCLDCLCAQTIDPSRYEICVVDNGSSDNTAEVVKNFAAAHPRHRILYLYVPEPGVCHAHNQGIAATSGEFLVFPDDDVRVPPTWMEQFAAHFRAHGSELAIVGGEVNPIWRGERPAWVKEGMLVFLSATTGLGHTVREAKLEETFIECNSCFRRTALAAVGNFPEYLGRKGTSLLCGQNGVEVAIKGRGGRAIFDPSIIIRHIIHADRLTPTWFRKRFFWQGVTGNVMQYYNRQQGLGHINDKVLNLNLPLKAEDWAFIQADTADGLEDSLHYFQSLGLVLSLTGIIPIDNG